MSAEDKSSPGDVRGASPKGKPSLLRPFFLLLSGGLTLALVIAAREVLLPFVLALVIAYVLTPFVAWFEKKKVKRAAAILLVYAIVLGTLGGFLWAVAPRMARELAGLRKELPALSDRAIAVQRRSSCDKRSRHASQPSSWRPARGQACCRLPA